MRGDRELTLRLVRPDDKALMRRGFERLSPESRYRRFFTNKSKLTDDELAYLTEVDGDSHFALGATTTAADGERVGVAIARFIRLSDNPTVAEAAIVVSDDWQKCGVGRLLFDRLVAAARERGVEHFRAEVLASNAPARQLLHEATEVVDEQADGDAVIIDMLLPDPDETPQHEWLLYRLFAMVASGEAQVVSALKRLVRRLASPLRGEQPDAADHADAS